MARQIFSGLFARACQIRALFQGPYSGPSPAPKCRAENWEQKIRETAIISPKGGGCLDVVTGSPRCTLQVPAYGGKSVDISLDARVGPRTSQLQGFRRSSSSHELLHPYSPSDSRHPLTSRDEPPRHWCGIIRQIMPWGQGTPGGEPPFPIAGPPLTMGTRCPWPWGQRCTIVAVFASCLLLGI